MFLRAAVYKQDLICEYLAFRGFDIAINSNFTISPECLELAVLFGADLQKVDWNNRNALECAWIDYDLEKVCFLMDLNVECEIENIRLTGSRLLTATLMMTHQREKPVKSYKIVIMS